MKTVPIKRSIALQPLSREHHHGLLLCWKIRTGLKKGIDIDRIKKYSDWFFKNSLLTHFNIEEELILRSFKTDEKKIKQILLNILSNSIKNTIKGKIKLNIILFVFSMYLLKGFFYLSTGRSIFKKMLFKTDS